jgi:hypothetical protein
MKNVRPRVDGEFRRQMKEYVARLLQDATITTDAGSVTLTRGSMHYFVKMPSKGPSTIEIVAPGTVVDGWLAAVSDGEYEAVPASSLGTERGDWPELRRSPGPPKQFPNRLELRYDDATRQALETIREKTGEDNSTIIRRLIAEAVA